MPTGASRNASIASSSSSESLWPSASKNLTPLYSGGLCEAERTIPRSWASSATAGVGSTPPRTAIPPAETIPAHDRLLERRPGAARVTADEDAATTGPGRRGAAEPLDEIERERLADDAANAIGAEVGTGHGNGRRRGEGTHALQARAA